MIDEEGVFLAWRLHSFSFGHGKKIAVNTSIHLSQKIKEFLHTRWEYTPYLEEWVSLDLEQTNPAWQFEISFDKKEGS